MKISTKTIWAVLIISFLLLLTFIFSELFPDLFHQDWVFIFNCIGSLSTLGTLIVALMAYFAVPKWVHQKSDEVSFNLADDLICNAFVDLIDSVDRVTFPFNFLLPNHYIHTKDSFEDIQERIESVSGEIWEISTKIRKIENTLLNLRRHGWNLKPHQKKMCDDFLNKYQYVFSAYLSGSTGIHLLKWPDPQEHEKENQENEDYLRDIIFETRDMVMGQVEPFLKEINLFLESKIEIEEFFTRNTK